MRAYLVTLKVMVHAKSEDAAMDKLNKAVEKAMKVAVAGVGLDVEEIPDE